MRLSDFVVKNVYIVPIDRTGENGRISVAGVDVQRDAKRFAPDERVFGFKYRFQDSIEVDGRDFIAPETVSDVTYYIGHEFTREELLAKPDDEIGGGAYSKKTYVEPLAAGAKIWVCKGKLIVPGQHQEFLPIEPLLAGAAAAKG
jgi:hypothetical protein